MPVFLQEVIVPEKCFLSEVLSWVAFHRLPVASYDADGVELHESREVYDYHAFHPDINSGYLTETECKTGGIPPDPHFQWLLEGEPSFTVFMIDGLLKDLGPDDPFRKKLEKDRKDAVRYEAECGAWDEHYQQALEYPISQIFVALKSGKLIAHGRLLPDLDPDKALQILEEQDINICDVEPSSISPAFWTLKKIDFEKSLAQNNEKHFCHICCSTRDVLTLFPGERSTINSVERVGDTFVLGDSVEKPKTQSLRGRPSYPWDSFHLEVTELIRNGSLPQKKEAAIQHFQDWFGQKHDIRPSRATIGEKLKPYYDKFVRQQDRK